MTFFSITMFADGDGVEEVPTLILKESNIRKIKNEFNPKKFSNFSFQLVGKFQFQLLWSSTVVKLLIAITKWPRKHTPIAPTF